MTLVKFLLLDFFVVLAVLPLIFVFKAKTDRSFLLRNSDASKVIDQTSINIPCLNKLLELERLSRREGSGIDFYSLIGFWNFVSVWKQESDKEDLISSALLRLFSASLELRKDQNKEEVLRFDIKNSIQFGALLIQFIGSGELKGSQPLLPFFFERIELRLADNILYSRTLDKPDERDRPFFALIAIDENGNWLAARGRGGGLALWVKN